MSEGVLEQKYIQEAFGTKWGGLRPVLFTGDTIMPFPRYLNKKDGNEEDWEKSVGLIVSIYPKETIIYPGHGDPLKLGEWIEHNKLY